MTVPLTRQTICLTTLVVLTCATAAQADFTPLGTSSASEAGHLSILEDFYSPGQAWSTTGSRTDGDGDLVDMTNGSLLATRVDDWGFGGILDAQGSFAGAVDDQSWTGTTFSFTAVARYASYTQEFGYDLAGDDLGYISLFDVSGSQMNVSGSATLELSPGDTVTWLRDGNYGGSWSSRSADNSDELDHLVTYYVSGMDDGLAHWMLFWEDLPRGGDKDYNDMVVEISAPVPDPGTGVTIVLASGTLVLLRRRLL